MTHRPSDLDFLFTCWLLISRMLISVQFLKVFNLHSKRMEEKSGGMRTGSLRIGHTAERLLICYRFSRLIVIDECFAGRSSVRRRERSFARSALSEHIEQLVTFGASAGVRSVFCLTCLRLHLLGSSGSLFLPVFSVTVRPVGPLGPHRSSCTHFSMRTPAANSQITSCFPRERSAGSVSEHPHCVYRVKGQFKDISDNENSVL